MEIGLETWESPAFLRSSRASVGGLPDSAFSSFAEEDGFVPGKGRKRPRFSMRDTEWRVVDEPESPCDKEPPKDWEEWLDEYEDDEAGVGEENLRDETDTGDRQPVAEGHATPLDNQEVPVAAELGGENAVRESPLSEIAESSQGRSTTEMLASQQTQPTNGTIKSVPDKRRMFEHALDLPTETPQLRPVPSFGLPVPSPLVTTSNDRSGYFTPDITSEQTQTRQMVQTTASSGAINVGEEAPADSAVGMEETNTTPRLSTTQTSGLASPALPANAQGEEDAQIFTSSTERADSQMVPHQARDEERFTAGNEYPEERPVAMEEHDRRDQYGEEGYELSVKKKDDQSRKSREDELEEDQKQAQFEEDDEEELESESELDEEEIERGPPDEGQPSIRQSPQLGSHAHTNDDDAEHVARDMRSESNVVIAEASTELEYHRSTSGIDSEGGPSTRREGNGDAAERTIENYECEVERHEFPHAQLPTESNPEGGYNGPALEGEDEEEGSHDEEEVEDEDEEFHSEEYEDEYESEIHDEDENDDDSTSNIDENEGLYGSESQQQPNAQQPDVIVLDSDSDGEAPVPVQPPVQPNQDTVGPHNRQLPEGVNEGELKSDDDFVNSEDEEGFSSMEEQQTSDADEGELEDEDTMEETDEVRENEFKEESTEDKPETKVEGGKPEEDDAKDAQIEQLETVDLKEESMEDEPEGEEEKDDAEREIEEGIGPNEAEEEQVKGEVMKGEMDIGEEAADVEKDDGASYQQPVASPETDSRNVQMAIDPDLLLTQHASENQQGQRIEGEPARSSEWDNHGLSLDGATASEVTQEFVDVSHKEQPSLHDSRYIASEFSKEVTACEQQITGNAAAESLPTPQDTQEYLTESTDQTQSEMPPGSQSIAGTPIATEGTTAPLDLNPPGASSYMGQGNPEELVPYNAAQERTKSPVDQLDSPLRDARGLSTKLSYYPPLATLVDHVGALTNTISIVHEAFPANQAPSDKGGYLLTAQLTDPSLAGTLLPAQISQPSKGALPNLADGDAILLRNFKVESTDHALKLASTNTSAWTIFPNNPTQTQTTDQDHDHDHPPAEHGNNETAYATKLREWYQVDGAPMVEDRKLQTSIQSEEAVEASPSPPRCVSAAMSEPDSYGIRFCTPLRAARRNSTSSSASARLGRKSCTSSSTPRRVTMHELRNGRRYPGAVSPADKNIVHRLRDGTLYATL